MLYVYKTSVRLQAKYYKSFSISYRISVGGARIGLEQSSARTGQERGPSGSPSWDRFVNLSEKGTGSRFWELNRDGRVWRVGSGLSAQVSSRTSFQTCPTAPSWNACPNLSPLGIRRQTDAAGAEQTRGGSADLRVRPLGVDPRMTVPLGSARRSMIAFHGAG
jgi:hypothetical protein